MADAHADRRDLALRATAFDDPYADAPVAPLAFHIEALQRPDQPFLEIADISAEIAPALL
jgi:hypothetical protein